jgi:hypothetical protein
MSNTMTDDELITRFTELSLPAAAFGHREHVRLAFAVLAKHQDFGDAAIEYRQLLRAFARHHGVPGKYHETITWAYLAIVHERMAGFADSEAMVAANPDLLDHQTGALAHYYDVGALIADPVARRVFVLPDPRPGVR